eukprot:TRINITY_DN1151_c0_g1_i2.p1 TRINITY_DN1151_c0_g1~~TRINITY_DN1151_c0_g1_i2.p1  ORF type:complete len:311 (+),score=78.77 TRINITY_DN1151_c0_g1_i2:117-1049(+)
MGIVFQKMKVLFAVLVLGTVCAGVFGIYNQQQMVNQIHAQQSQWTATTYSRWEGMTEEQIKGTFGIVPRNETDLPKVSYSTILEFTDIPTNFDIRDKWPNCKFGIRDQKQCGSCWAFGATEAFEDRLCIQSGEKTKVLLSPQALVDCDSDNYGCGGGWPVLAWGYIRDNGLPTETCYPYKGVDGKCQKKCATSETYTTYKAKNVRTYTSTDAVKLDILTGGPIETWFAVYQDFLQYKSGVYNPTSTNLLGYHAIEVVGWGVQNNVAYWIAANSWGSSWGENGYFKIQAGTCQFDQLDHFVGGDAVVSTEF